MIPLSDDAKNEDFPASSVLVAYSEDQQRWNMFIKIDDNWTLVTERGPIPTKIRYADIATGSMYPLNHGQVFVLHRPDINDYLHLLERLKAESTV